MKKLIISILLFSFLLTGSASYASGLSNTSTTLSEMTPTECIAFIQTQGLVIPAELEDYVRLGEFVQQIIEIVEQNPSATFMWNYDVTLAFANEIKAVVNDWYGVAILPENTTYFPRISSGLSDNTPVGVWYEKYRFFNCYAYALGYRYSPTGEIYFVNPGSYSRPDLFRYQ